MKYFKVTNFEKYQPKRNGKHAPWIRLYHTWNLDPAIGQLCDSHKAHWIGLMCIAHATDNEIPWDTKWIKKRGCFDSNVNLDKFESLGLIEILCNKDEKDGEQEKPIEKNKKRKKEKYICEDKDRPHTDTYKAEKFWKAEYLKANGIEPDMSPAKDRTILKDLIARHGIEVVMKKIPLHIESGRLLSIGGFKTKFNDLGVAKQKPFESSEERHEREMAEMRERLSANRN